MQIPTDTSILWRAALTATLVAVFLTLVPFHRLAAATNETAEITTAGPPLEVADGFLLAIPKAGFGKDYLFTASLIPQAGARHQHGPGGQDRPLRVVPRRRGHVRIHARTGRHR